MERIGLQVPDHVNARYGQTMYNLVHLPGGKCRVDWWTSDNLDQGNQSMEASASYDEPDERHAIEMIVGQHPYGGPLNHSWLGYYDNPVFVHIDGRFMPFKEAKHEQGA